MTAKRRTPEEIRARHVATGDGKECVVCGPAWPCDASIIAESSAQDREQVAMASRVFVAALMAVGKPVLVQDRHLHLADEWQLQSMRVPEGGTLYRVIDPKAASSPLSKLVLPGGSRLT